MFTKIKHALMITGAAAILGAGIYFLYGGFDYGHIYDNANIWYKVSSDELNEGEIIALDMSGGYSACQGPYIYLAVNDLNSGEEIVVVFPNGGNWHSEKVDTVSVEIQKHFGELEEDLRK